MKHSPRLVRKIQKLESIEKLWLEQLQKLQQRRLGLGLGVFVLLVISQMAKGFFLELVALFIVFPLFVVFLKKSRRVQSFCQSLGLLKDFYHQQNQFRQGLFSKNTLPEQMHDTHLARDLDLGVFFANMSRCFTSEGTKLLNQWLCQEFKTSKREQRLSQLKEICNFPGLVRKLQITQKESLTDFSKIENEVCRSFFPEKISWKWLIPLSWLLLVISLAAGLPSIIWKICLLTYVGTVLSYLNHTQHLFSRLQDLHQDFTGLGDKILHLEKLGGRLSFTPELKKAAVSHDVKKMSFLIALISFKSNPILFYILNMIVPWDFILAEASERYRIKFYAHFKIWSLEVVQVDALASLANIWFYHETVWPKVNDSPFVQFTQLRHPLLNQDSVIPNDFDPASQDIFIITGSNMSGKSTFLRAVGLNYCLANIGAPVFADQFQFKPMPLVSCIRVSDSLRDGQSYFFAEVQRMKSILKKAKEQPLLFLIDEPLRGTNNRERLIGNRAYLQQVLELNAHGFISTHDLELTQLADESERIKNYHFSDRWEKEELIFDYKIKDGPSKTTNALKILAREGLYSAPSS